MANVYNQIRRQGKKEDLIRQILQTARAECQHGTESFQSKFDPKGFSGDR
jgi:hypothetical protein